MTSVAQFIPDSPFVSDVGLMSGLSFLLQGSITGTQREHKHRFCVRINVGHVSSAPDEVPLSANNYDVTTLNWKSSDNSIPSHVYLPSHATTTLKQTFPSFPTSSALRSLHNRPHIQIYLIKLHLQFLLVFENRMGSPFYRQVLPIVQDVVDGAIDHDFLAVGAEGEDLGKMVFPLKKLALVRVTPRTLSALSRRNARRMPCHAGKIS